MLSWYLFAASLGVSLGYAPVAEEQQPIDLSFFLLPENVWFYGYFFLSAVVFCGAWHLKALNHPWKIWSIWGSALIIFVTYFGVQISVVINNWRLSRLVTFCRTHCRSSQAFPSIISTA